MKATKPIAIELLAPARDADTGIEAVRHGADAVYIGAPAHGARASAANSIEDIERLCQFAHLYNARVYATVNTLIYDDELADVERMVADLYRAGVDALIVQDMALLRLDIPPIDLHASTQCDIRTPERARWLAEAGFSQLVLPRELTLDETRRIREAVGPSVALEAFVHGALCVSYSGDCQASCVATGRSANRGECAQICRLPYEIVDADGRVVAPRRHYLSLRDLNRSTLLAQMLDAGITSLKIEGRLKDAGYVKNVTASYRRLLDEIIDASDGRYTRASDGRVTTTFTPDLGKSFNRGFTTYFTTAPRPHVQMASIDTPKWKGEPVGRVKAVKGRVITAELSATIANGDGLGCMGADGTYSGFRVNRVEGNRLFAASDLAGVRPGAALFRNRDKVRDDQLAGPTATRKIAVEMTLRTDAAGRLVLDLADERGCRVSVADPSGKPVEKARTEQTEAHRRVLTKTGDTVLTVTGLTDNAPDAFVPASQLTALRRLGVETLLRARATTRPVRLRVPGQPVPQLPAPTELTYHDNVANRIAAQIYKEAGATCVAPALETLSAEQRRAAATRVMTTRYCVRRELGSCLRDDRNRRLPDGPLYLRASAGLSYRLDFDCAACRMHVMMAPGR